MEGQGCKILVKHNVNPGKKIFRDFGKVKMKTLSLKFYPKKIYQESK